MDFLSVWIIRFLFFEWFPGWLWGEGYEFSLPGAGDSALLAESYDALDAVDSLDGLEGLSAEEKSNFAEPDAPVCSFLLHFGTWSVARQETSFWLSGWSV